MNQDERRIFLIKELLKEDKRYKNIEIPKNPYKSRVILKSTYECAYAGNKR